MIQDEIEKEFLFAYKAWSDCLKTKGSLIGKLDDEELREVVIDNGGRKMMMFKIPDSEKCMAKLLWDKYVSARNMMIAVVKNQNEL